MFNESITNEISRILANFRPCFSRTNAFSWFVIVIFGLIVRFDHNGVTSFIRWFGLVPSHYTALLHFFRADSWSLGQLLEYWLHVILANCPLITVDDRLVAIIDATKVISEGFKTPGVKKLHQESDNSAKPEYMFGHEFGCIGLLIGGITKMFCIPAMMWLQQGEGIDMLTKSDVPLNIISLTVLKVEQLVKGLAGKSILLVVDAYYAVGTFLAPVGKIVDKNGRRSVHVITRARPSYTATMDLEPYCGRGRPRKYGKTVKLRDVFRTYSEQFQTAKLRLYGKLETISYFVMDLYWKPAQSKIRFVFVLGLGKLGKPLILMSTDLTLQPLDIITAYSYRFKIETLFNVLKNVIGAFDYHFWTSAWPKLQRTSKVQAELPKDPHSLMLIKQAYEAIEAFVNFSCIAVGILQIIALNFQQTVWQCFRGWLRTFSSEVPSEETVQSVVREEYIFRKFRRSLISQIITSKKRKNTSQTPALSA